MAYAVFFGAQLTNDEKTKAYAEIDRLLKYIDSYLSESDYDYLVNDNFGPADAYLFVLTNWSTLLSMI